MFFVRYRLLLGAIMVACGVLLGFSPASLNAADPQTFGNEPQRLGKIGKYGKYTPEQYIKQAKAYNAKIIPEGKLKILGTRMICGRRPTVLDPQFEDYGGAYDGFLILNPTLMRSVPKTVQLWIYAHECAHQFRGIDELSADCFAVKRGRRRGWLTKNGVEKICKFIWPARGDYMHPPGPVRCKEMRRCFNDAYRHKLKKTKAEN